jgi:VanZ family protein
MPRALKPWLPVFLWMGVIFMASTGLGSSAHTSLIIEPLIRWLDPGISPEALERAHLLVRKGGHLSEYALLALLALRAARLSAPAGHAPSFVRAAGIALLVSTAYAATDEFHQSFVPERTSSAWDVLIDATGALTALALAALVRKLRNGAVADRGVNARQSSAD